MSHPLDGARERLNRAEQNIHNLNSEITDFLKPAPIIVMTVDVERREPIVTDENRKAWEDLQKFGVRKVPLRFRVLAGEIIHHLRCAFDHIAWQLSSPESQTKFPTRIEFPVFDKDPSLDKEKLQLYQRKIKGIASATALARIDGLQPHRRPNPLRDPLWLIHNMDRIDKHREVVMAIQIMKLQISAGATAIGFGIQKPWENRPRRVQLVGHSDVEMNVKISANITLGEFTGANDESIIPTLVNLLRFTRNSVQSFSGEFV